MTPDAVLDQFESTAHVFDQTNGVLGHDPEAVERRKHRSGGAEGDVPGATHVVLGL